MFRASRYWGRHMAAMQTMKCDRLRLRSACRKTLFAEAETHALLRGSLRKTTGEKAVRTASLTRGNRSDAQDAFSGKDPTGHGTSRSAGLPSRYRPGPSMCLNALELSSRQSLQFPHHLT